MLNLYAETSIILNESHSAVAEDLFHDLRENGSETEFKRKQNINEIIIIGEY